jgi:hypothetical protein
MRNFTFLIGSSDDDGWVQYLKTAYFSGDYNFENYNASAYHISLSEESKVEGCSNLAAIAVEIGRGRAMADGWCLDDTFSCLMGE